jgi:death on curing protein
MNTIIYLEPAEVIANHDKIILASGGLSGLRDEGLLDSALTMIQNDLYYPTFSSKLVHLIFSINKNHCFCDGNKRTSISSGASFLLKNGWSPGFVKFFIINMENVVVRLADDEINKDELALIINILLLRFEINQSLSRPNLEIKLKLKISDTYNKTIKMLKDWNLIDLKPISKEEFRLITCLEKKHKKHKKHKKFKN